LVSTQNYLIDTNVFIGLEDDRQVSPEFSSLLQLAARHGVNVFVHEAARDDLLRDRDEVRRAVSLSKLDKFQTIAKVRGLTKEALEAEFGPLAKPNDIVDATLLHAIRINAADFLITEDAGLHNRARRYAPAIAGRVLHVVDAADLLRTNFEPVNVPIRFVEELEANSIPLDDCIFDSLREGYPGFDDWWRNSCVANHRKCWIVTDRNDSGISGIVVRKDEGAGNTDATNKGTKILKVCTFKVRPESRGVKLGELLLKQILWFSQSNKYDVVYLTTFPTQTTLIALLEYYGFEATQVAYDGEITYEKTLSRDPVSVGPHDNFFEIACAHYPRFYAGSHVKAYGIPIKEDYHDTLFPELREARQSNLFDLFGISTDSRRPGNTIRKVYICRAAANIEQPGAILFFYKGRSNLPPSQSITTVGIFEEMALAFSTEELSRLTGGRSVYSEHQLESWEASPERPVKVLNFLLAGYMAPAMSLDELQSEGVFNGHPPQSIFQITPQRLEPIFDRLDLGFDLR
jgi:ribosomal protein S18 acetylase RimI-like enzyme